MKKRKYSSFSPPFSFLNLLNFFLLAGIIILIFLLIQERTYLEQNKFLINKYRIYLSSIFSNNNQTLKILRKQPTNPSSSTNFVYISPDFYSYLQKTNQ